MFEWFSSKVAMSVAVIILVAAMIGFFAYINSRVSSVEFSSIPEAIASAVDRTATTNENITTRVTFVDGSTNGTYIDPMFKNNGYHIMISSSEAVVQQSSLTASAAFSKKIHLWKPDSTVEVTKKATLDGKDALSPPLEFESGKDFLIENKRLTVDLVYEYHCFIYFP